MTGSTDLPERTNDEEPAAKPARLYYLDWLRNILIFGVFVYHALSPFREGLDWHITNPDRSVAVTSVFIFLWPWALPLFFLVAGAASRFALRRRSSRQYVRERVARLLIPFIAGSIQCGDGSGEKRCHAGLRRARRRSAT